VYFIELYRRHKLKLNILLAYANSFVYMINNSGPKIETCGTPVVIENILDLILSISLYSLRCSMYVLNKLIFVPCTP